MSEAPYVVLARKHRPQSFDDVLGQEAVSTTLKNALEAGRLAHAYLFTGPRGVGKTTLARILAKAINCAKGAGSQPCGKCDPCREITASSCIDVLEMDAASHTGVDNVRENIIDTVALATSRDRYKVFIIDEAHMLSTGAFNALLKTLEEPPAHVVFILATTEAVKIPSTIASRCQRFRFRPVPADLLASHLGAMAKKEKIVVEPAALELLARCAGGSVRDGVGLLDQAQTFGDKKVTEAAVREMFGFAPRELLGGVGAALFARQAPELAHWLKRAYEEGVEAAQILKDLRDVLEPVYLEKLGAEQAADPVWRKLAAPCSAEGLAFILRRINRTLEELRASDSPRLTLELGLFGCLEAAGDLVAWVARLEALERRLAAGAGPASAPAEVGDTTLAGVMGDTTEVVSPPQAGGAARQIWSRVLEAVGREKPSLGEALAKAGLSEASSTEWTLTLAREFDLRSAERALSLIEAKLATAAGRKIRVLLRLGEAPAAAESGEIVDEGIPPSPSGAPEAGSWKDVTDGEPDPGNHPLKKAEKILGGTFKIVKKK